MRRIASSSSLRIAVALIVLAGGISACASAVGNSEAGNERIGAYGVTASLPDGWDQVQLRDLPGAKVPLELASFGASGAVRGICTPGPIVDQIPPGGALLQLLDDGGFGGARDHQAGAVSGPGPLRDYEPLARPFRLGAPEGHECGEGYNVFFRKSGRVFQLRIWTSLAGPSQTVRGQIEALMDSLQVRPSPAQGFETERWSVLDRSEVGRIEWTCQSGRARIRFTLGGGRSSRVGVRVGPSLYAKTWLQPGGSIEQPFAQQVQRWRIEPISEARPPVVVFRVLPQHGWCQSPVVTDHQEAPGPYRERANS